MSTRADVKGKLRNLIPQALATALENAAGIPTREFSAKHLASYGPVASTVLKMVDSIKSGTSRITGIL